MRDSPFRRPGITTSVKTKLMVVPVCKTLKASAASAASMTVNPSRRRISAIGSRMRISSSTTKITRDVVCSLRPSLTADIRRTSAIFPSTAANRKSLLRFFFGSSYHCRKPSCLAQPQHGAKRQGNIVNAVGPAPASIGCQLNRRHRPIRNIRIYARICCRAVLSRPGRQAPNFRVCLNRVCLRIFCRTSTALSLDDPPAQRGQVARHRGLGGSNAILSKVKLLNQG